MKETITRDEAWALLQEFSSSENHVRHMLAVEAAMRAYARRFGEDRWRAYTPVLLAGYACGTGLIAMLSIGFALLMKAITRAIV